MREGEKIQNKITKEFGVIKTIIGNVAIVTYEDGARKELLTNLIEAEKTATHKKFIEAHQNMLSDESIQSLFEEKLDDGDMEYYRTNFMLFGRELYKKLFEDNES